MSGVRESNTVKKLWQIWYRVSCPACKATAYNRCMTTIAHPGLLTERFKPGVYACKERQIKASEKYKKDAVIKEETVSLDVLSKLEHKAGGIQKPKALREIDKDFALHSAKK